ncbi:MAG: FkbM family methyltransferase [Gemmatimonadales bacterium]
MRLKEFFFLLGLKPRARDYGFAIEVHQLPRDGRIEVAQWQHDGAYRIAPTQATVDQFRRFLCPGDVAIDIGAHTGDTALPIALAVGPTGTVLAMEPNRHVFPVLLENAARNRDKTNIIPLPFAAMRADGRYEFQYGEAGYCNGGFHEGMNRWQHKSAYKLMVDGRNLQDLLYRDYHDLIPRIRLIKVDAEGFDLAILMTVDALIRAQRPYLQVEMFDIKRSERGYRAQLFEFLVGHQYDVHRIDHDTLLGEQITWENLMRWRGYDVWCVPRPAVARSPT